MLHDKVEAFDSFEGLFDPPRKREMTRREKLDADFAKTKEEARKPMQEAFDKWFRNRS